MIIATGHCEIRCGKNDVVLLRNALYIYTEYWLSNVLQARGRTKV